jgi:hypothetical protein
MCLACIEADLWAAYEADLAARAERTAADAKDAKVPADTVPMRRPGASECECK